MTSITALVLGAGNPLDTPFLDASRAWDILILLVMFAIGWMALKAAKAGAQQGQPAQLGRYAACAVIVCGILWIAGHVVAVSESDSFDEVGCMAKVGCDKAGQTAPTTR